MVLHYGCTQKEKKVLPCDICKKPLFFKYESLYDGINQHTLSLTFSCLELGSPAGTQFKGRAKLALLNQYERLYQHS